MSLQTSKLSPSFLAKFSKFLSDAMGLYFPKEGWKDFERKLSPIANAFGFKDITACVEWLMQAPLTKDQITTLALYLTVGETYFFRDESAVNILEKKILPEIIRKRESKDKTIRIWSAASCTGEEAYTVAILLSRLINDISTWNISILGSDINLKFLQKATSGIYKEWSFRTTPKAIRDKYFTKDKEDRYHLSQEIKKLVKFSYLNLVEDSYPSVVNETNAMDVILCNNVLIYFSHKQINKVLKQLTSSLVERGYLIVSAIEAPFVKDSRLTPYHFGDKLVFVKTNSEVIDQADEEAESAVTYPFFNQPLEIASPKEVFPPKNIRIELPAFLNLSSPYLDVNFETAEKPNKTPKVHVERHAPTPTPKNEVPVKTSKLFSEASQLFDLSKYSEVINKIEESLKNSSLEGKISEISLLIRAYANKGQLKEAQEWTERILKVEKLDPGLYFLNASILQEQNDLAGAVKSLQRALYLDSDFVMAHFSLGNLLKVNDSKKESNRHFRNALELLSKYPPEEVIPFSEGLTAKMLMEIIKDMKIT